jgi:site-specific recombinase XerD
MHIDIATKEYLHYIRFVRGHSPKTVESYASKLYQFKTQTGITNTDQITPLAYDAFLVRLRTSGVSQNTTAGYANAIRSFLKYLYRRGEHIPDLAVIETPRRIRTEMQWITEEDLGKILKHMHRERDRLIALVLFGSGVRIGELEQLTVERLQGNTFTVMGKGNKPRTCHLPPEIADRLREYIKVERLTGHVFTGQEGKPLKVPAMAQIIRNTSKKAGLHGVHPHSFRHGFATHLIRQGAHVELVRDMLGHEHIQTTQRYMHTTGEDVREAYDKYAPKLKSL